MKFKDIKVGDTVYVHSEVRVGFNSYEYFLVTVKVVKVTNTQFTCDNNERYGKERGNRIGGGYGDYAYMLGEKIGYNKKEVKDQTKEYEDFLIKLKLISNVVSIAKGLDHNTKLGIDELKNIIQILNSK